MNLNFQSSVAGNRLQTYDNRLHVQNSNSKPFSIALFYFSLLVIDYQSLAWLWNPLFWGKTWSLVNLETRLCLLKQSWINLEANAYPLKRPYLILLWHHQNSYIHTFTIQYSQLIIYSNYLFLLFYKNELYFLFSQMNKLNIFLFSFNSLFSYSYFSLFI